MVAYPGSILSTRSYTMTLWIETEGGMTVFQRARSAYQKGTMVHIINCVGKKRVIQGTLKRARLIAA